MCILMNRCGYRQSSSGAIACMEYLVIAAKLVGGTRCEYIVLRTFKPA